MRIGSIAPLSYTPGGLEVFSFVRGQTGADYHQGPVFHRYPDGRVMMVWWAYDFDECSRNGVCLYSVSADGCRWSGPQVYFADYPGGTAVPRFLALRDSERALMVLTRFLHTIEVDSVRRVATRGSNYFRDRAAMVVRESADGGATFNHGTELPYALATGGKELPGTGFYGCAEEMIQLACGRIVMPVYYMDPDRADAEVGRQHYSVSFLLSDDEGRTWTRSNEITTDTVRGAMEPTVVESEPGRLYCLLRTKGGCLYETRSEDGGETWSAPRPSQLPAPESMARMIRLASGNLLLVWNNVSSPTQQPRHPLVAALSSDGGATWSNPRMIADESGANQLSNHGVTQLTDGRVLVGISHYHARRPMTSDLDMAIFDEAWARGKDGSG